VSFWVLSEEFSVFIKHAEFLLEQMENSIFNKDSASCSKVVLGGWSWLRYVFSGV